MKKIRNGLIDIIKDRQKEAKDITLMVKVIVMWGIEVQEVNTVNLKNAKN